MLLDRMQKTLNLSNRSVHIICILRSLDIMSVVKYVFFCVYQTKWTQLCGIRKQSAYLISRFTEH